MSSAGSCLLVAARQFFASVRIIAGWLTPRPEEHLSNNPLDQCGGVHRCTFRLTRGRYWFATNMSRCHESPQSVDRQHALRPPDTVAVRHRSELSGIGGSAIVRCHESVTSRYDSRWTGSDGDVRKLLQTNKYRVQRSSGESTSRDLKSAQCRFESDWGHQSPYGSGFLDPDSAFGVVAWTSTSYHGFEWTTETADFRSARDLHASSYCLRIRAAQGRFP